MKTKKSDNKGQLHKEDSQLYDLLLDAQHILNQYVMIYGSLSVRRLLRVKSSGEEAQFEFEITCYQLNNEGKVVGHLNSYSTSIKGVMLGFEKDIVEHLS